MLENLSKVEKKITRCPICQGGFLQVEKVDEDDETLSCPICGIKFRNASSSEHLMFLETPLNFPGNMVGLWLTRPEIGKALHEYRMTLNKIGIINQAKQRSIEIPKENPVRAQAVRQAREMIANHKSIDSVHDLLVNNFQLTEYAIEEIIQDAVAVSEARKKLRREQVLKFSLLVFLLLLVIAVSIFLFTI